MGISIPCNNVSGIIPHRRHNVVYCSGGGVRWCPWHICSAQMKFRQRPLPFLTSAAEYTVLSYVQRCQLGILCVEAAHTVLLQSVHAW